MRQLPNRTDLFAADTGCEHFDISAVPNPAKILYRWLAADPINPGNVKPVGGDISLPAPIWVAVPPAPTVCGDAQWVKVYIAEQNGQVDLDDLVGDNHAVVPENAAQVESGWALLQQDPPDGGRSRKLVNQVNLGNGHHAVVRRYEHYEYAGGAVSSSDKVFSCGSNCYGVHNHGATGTLTDKASSGGKFSMWGGACASNAPTCAVTLNT